MESFQHVENLPSHRLACGECGNKSLENFLKRYSIRASLKSSRLHPYLRPIENVCSEANDKDFDKRKKHFLSDHNFKKDGDLIQLEMCIEKDSATGFLPHQHESLIQVNSNSSNQSLTAELKTLHFSNHPGGNKLRPCANKSPHSDCKSRLNNPSHQSTRASLESDKMVEFNISSNNNNRAVVDTLHNSICHNSVCDMCRDYDKVQFHLESLLASGTESVEALNLIEQMHCCSHGGRGEDLEFECELCGCSFDGCGELVSHLSLHPENWPYVCQVCKRRFKSSLEEGRHTCREGNKIGKF